MLSRYDIEKELGKNICVYPFNYNNLKENSINLTASKYSWTINKFKIYFNEETNIISLEKTKGSKEIIFEKGEKPLIKIGEKDYIVLCPNSVTLIETKEVLSVGPYIGGAFHSKVGLAARGAGHIGTMLGPNFSGKCLIPLHNITNNLIKIDINETIVSVTFDYLDSSIKNEKNPTNSGHIDKFAQYGIEISEDDRTELDSDWMTKFLDVKDHMEADSAYKEYLKNRKKRHPLKKYLNWRTFFFFLAWLLINGVICLIASKIKDKDWSNRLWNIEIAVAASTIFAFIGLIKPKR